MSDIKQSDNAEKLYDMLIDKSKESFMMAIEVYNKPTIKYRVEGFSMFICNAWELMLKAYLIKERGMSSIYFSDHPDRTISLHECVKKVFTNDKDPLRMNLEKIIELRNTSTHFITQEYEMVYVPLFQSGILNFNDKMMDLHNIDMTDVIPQNFLSLSVSLKSLSENEIKAKYPEIVSKKLIKAQHDIENSSAINNPRYAITVNVNHFLTRKRNDADAVFHLARDGEQPLAVVKELKNPEDVYKYGAHQAVKTIERMLEKRKIVTLYNGAPHKITAFHFNNLVKYYGIKENEQFCWKYTAGNATTYYKYSLQALEFLVDEISKDPNNIFDSIKKDNPRGKGMLSD